jgi:23S rRNA pseudouridine2605 synthase
MSDQNEERLQKALARAGIASRRASEELILAGRVKINGKVVTELGIKIDPTQDRVTVDDEPVPVKVSAAPQKIYLMLNKPSGYLSTVSDPQGRPTIMDLVVSEKAGRLYPVGRLDADTEGLLLLTNDGAFSNALSHPRFGVDKEYVALLDGIIAMKDLDRLRKGVAIRVEDPETGERVEHITKPARVDLIRHEGSNSLVRFILKEGKKRQIRLMADTVDHPVVELKRVRLGPVKLGDLASGKTRNLSKQEVKELLDASKPRPETAEATASSGGPKGRGRGAPATRVEPFKSPVKSGRRFGERRFGEEPFGQTAGRRGAAPTRGPRPGSGRFESDDDTRPTAPRRGRPPGQSLLPEDNDRPNTGPGRGRPGPDFDQAPREQGRGRPSRDFDRSDNEQGRGRPSRDFERSERPAPDQSRGRTGRDFERSERPAPDQSRGRTGRDFERSAPDQDRGRPGRDFDRTTPDQGRGRPSRDFERPAPDQGRGRPSRDFERPAPDQGRGRPGPADQGRGRPAPAFDRRAKFSSEDADEGRGSSRPGKPAGRFSPSGPSFGGVPPSKRGKHSNPNGFIPAADRPAPTPGRGGPSGTPRKPAGNSAPDRGNGPARNRPSGPRPEGPGRGRRD